MPHVDRKKRDSSRNRDGLGDKALKHARQDGRFFPIRDNPMDRRGDPIWRGAEAAIGSAWTYAADGGKEQHRRKNVPRHYYSMAKAHPESRKEAGAGCRSVSIVAR